MTRRQSACFGRSGSFVNQREDWFPVIYSTIFLSSRWLALTAAHYFSLAITFRQYALAGRSLIAVYSKAKPNLKRGYNLESELWRGGLRLKLVWLSLSLELRVHCSTSNKRFLSEALNVTPSPHSRPPTRSSLPLFSHSFIPLCVEIGWATINFRVNSGRIYYPSLPLLL